MPTIKQVEHAIQTRDDIAIKTRQKYIKKFKAIIVGCDNSNFIARLNDTDYIINVYLKGKAARTIETYVGEIMAINHSITVLTDANLKIIVDYRDKTKRDAEAIKTEPKTIIPIESNTIETQTDEFSSDEEEEEEDIDTKTYNTIETQTETIEEELLSTSIMNKIIELQAKYKIALQYEEMKKNLKL